MGFCNCCTVARREFSSPLFDLFEEPSSSSSNDTTTKINDNTATATTEKQRIDIQQTFSPRPHILFLTAKLFIAVWILALLANSIIISDDASFWLAYLTHWGWVITSAYGVSSVVCAVYLAVKNKGGGDAAGSGVNNLEGGGGLIVKATWALFAIALPAEIVIAILFWILEFSGTLTYTSAMIHGGGVLLLLVDGFLLSRIPLRMKHLFLVEGFAALYLVWNVIHSFSGIGNPNRNEGEDDDDAIYASMKWKNNTGMACAVGAATLFVLIPVVFLICRWVSRLLSKRVVSGDDFVEKKECQNEDGFIVQTV